MYFCKCMETTLRVPYSSFFQLGDETEMKKVENDMVRSASCSTLAHTTKRQGEKENFKPSKKPRKETTKGVRAPKNRYNYKEVSQSIYMYIYKYTSIYSHSYCSKCVGIFLFCRNVMAVNTMTAVFCQFRALTLRRPDYKAQRMLSPYHSKLTQLMLQPKHQSLHASVMK